MPEDILKTIIGGLIITAIALNLIGSAVFGGGATTQYADVELVGGDGEIQTGLYGTVDGVESAESTLGDAVVLTGSDDSAVTVTTDLSVGNQWSVCSYASASQDVVSNHESRVITGLNDIVLAYNGTDDEYRVWYYNASTRNSYVATVPAPSASSNTLVCANHNGTHLTASRNTTVGTAVETSGDNIAPEPASSNWNGTLDETRVFGENLNATQRQSYVNHPVLSVPGDPAAVRVMYDVRSRGVSSVPAYFASGDASLSNATLTDGLSGPSLSKGSDYRVDGDRIVATDGGQLEGDGDVLFVTWDRGRNTEAYLATLGVVLFIFGYFASRLLDVIDS